MNEPTRTTGIFKRSPRRSVFLSFSLNNPLLQGFVGLSLLGAAIALLTPSLHGGGPQLTRADIGQPAPTDIKIPRIYIHQEVDERATREKATQAVAAVLPVYDYHLEIKDSKLSKIQRAFQLMRQTSAPFEAKLSALEAGKKPAAKGGDNQKKQAQIETQRTQLQAELRAALQAKQSEFFDLLDDTLADDEFETLLLSRFGKQTEENLSILVSSAMGNKIVGTSRQLDPILRSQGVSLRIRRGPKIIDSVSVRSFEDFASIKQAAEGVAEKARQRLKGVDPHLRDVLVAVARRMLEDNCEFNEFELQRRREVARSGVQELVTTQAFQAGQILVDKGHIVTETHLRIYEGAFQPAGATDLAQVTLGLGVFLLLLCAVIYRYGTLTLRKFSPSKRDLVLMGSWSLVLLLLARVAATINPTLSESWDIISTTALNWGLPAAAGAMLIRLVLNAETAALFAIFLAVLLSLVFDAGFAYGAFALVGGLVGALGVGHAKLRTDVLKAGLQAGVANALVVCCFALFEGQILSIGTAIELAFAFGGGILAGLVVNSVGPVVESLFGYTTNIKLLELANLNNPLLKDLAIRAPGTFHHSILTGTLAEAAAEEIHANPLLARVGAYHHDVGKAKTPEYFAENQKGPHNPHDKLRPSMSVLILKDHVKDGVRILAEHGYPQPIVDICAQHLGTTLIRFFYEKARKSAEENGEPIPDETNFRYPGPRPQTREAALVFLADSIEAAAKSLTDPTPARLKGMVHKIINMKFIDGQFEECALTLKDLHQIANAFTRVLTGIYHHRPQYPHQKKEAEERGQSDHNEGKGARAGLPTNQEDGQPSAQPEDPPPESTEGIRRLGASGR